MRKYYEARLNNIRATFTGQLRSLHTRARALTHTRTAGCCRGWTGLAELPGSSLLVDKTGRSSAPCSSAEPQSRMLEERKREVVDAGGQ